MPDPLYLVRLDACPLESVSGVLAICNAVVSSDRDRTYHEMTLMTQMIYPPYRLPRKVQKNLTLERANKMVADLARSGATATAVEQL